jgi:hypothetical protein
MGKKRFPKELTRIDYGLLGFRRRKGKMPMTKPREPKTYFEQVPLEIVKKIAEEDISDDVANRADVTVKLPAKKRSAFPRLRSDTLNSL